MQQSYGNTPPTTTASGISMGPGHWATNKNTPVHLHQANTDITMEGVKDEYLLATVSTVQQTATASTAPDFSQPRSMPGIPAIDPVQNICASAAVVPTVAWPAATAMATASTQAAFSSPSLVSANARRPPLPLSPASWGPMEQAASKGMPNSMIATSGFSVPCAYGAPLPPSYTAMYNEEPSVGISGYDGNAGLYGTHIQTPAIRSLSPQLVLGQSSETMVTVPAPLPADRVVSTLPYRGEPSPKLGKLGLLPQDILPVSLSREARSALPTYIDIYWDKVHPLYPIIHRATVEDGTDNVPEQVHVLRCAMAAVATQFLGHREHRVSGSQLHAYAWHKSKAVGCVFVA